MSIRGQPKTSRSSERGWNLFQPSTVEYQTPIISPEVLRSILSHDLPSTIRFSLGLVDYYRRFPCETPLVRYSDIPFDLIQEHKTRSFGCLVGECLSKRPASNTQVPRQSLINFKERWSCFQGADFDDWFVAGGAVVAVCARSYNRDPDEDADVFVLSPTTEGCVLVEEKIVSCITTSGRGVEREMNSTFSRTMITNDYHKVQIIKRGYNKRGNGGMAQCLAMFDLSSCKFGYGRIQDSEEPEIFCTLDGAIALFHGINIVDWKAESPSFWTRLEKYNRRGFRIVYPSLQFPPNWKFQGKLSLDRVCLHLDPVNTVLMEPVKGYKTLSDYDPNELSFAKVNSNLILTAAIKKDTRGVYLYRGENREDSEDERSIEEKPWFKVNAFTELEKVLRIWRPEEKNSTNETQFKFFWGPELYPRALILKATILGVDCEAEGSGSLAVLRNAIRDYYSLIVKRAEEIQIFLNNAYRQIEEGIYLTENPGQQFHGSFNPIIRRHPREFWNGNSNGIPVQSWKSYPTNFCYKEKFTLMCIRKYHPASFFGRMLKDIFWEFIRGGGYIDCSYLQDVYSAGLIDHGKSMIGLPTNPAYEEIRVIEKAKKIIASNPQGKLERRVASILQKLLNPPRKFKNPETIRKNALRVLKELLRTPESSPENSRKSSSEQSDEDSFDTRVREVVLTPALMNVVQKIRVNNAEPEEVFDFDSKLADEIIMSTERDTRTGIFRRV